MKYLLIALLIAGAGLAQAASQSPYAGQESRQIKALSSDEIHGLRQGEGMGLAMAAELNQYPGPRHVLELAEELHLSRDHRIFDDMRANAVDLGTRVIEYEQELDALFASEQVSDSSLNALLLKIGETRALLRAAHLRAHLEMKKILSGHQVAMYDNLRGYGDHGSNHKHKH